jgi:hypothetical protein
LPRPLVIAGAAVRGGTTGAAPGAAYRVGKARGVAGKGAESGQHPLRLAVAGGALGAFAAFADRAKLFEFVLAFIANVFVDRHIYLTNNSLTFLMGTVNNSKKTKIRRMEV